MVARKYRVNSNRTSQTPEQSSSIEPRRLRRIMPVTQSSDGYALTNQALIITNVLPAKLSVIPI
jgi:hypothetical protein